MTVTGLEQELSLIESLKSAGYPSESLVHGMRLNNGICVDLMVMDPKCCTPVAVFEVKTQISSRGVDFGVRHLLRCRALLRVSVRSFLAIPKADGFGFDLFEVPESTVNGSVYFNNLQRYKLDGIPQYLSLCSGADSKSQVAAQEYREERVDKFECLSRALSSLLFFIFIVDFVFDKAHLDTQNTTVLAMSVLTLLLPYYDVITLKELSLCRKQVKEPSKA